ncbi:MAG TPA: heme-binding protein [Chthonomonadaceae bacterium]|nr:heme-binding protein [Chthonomonadaceae bacterium]
MYVTRKSRLLFLGGLTALVAGALALMMAAPKTRALDGGSSGLTPADLNTIVTQAVNAANNLTSPFRSIAGTTRTTKMHIAVVARDGRLLTLRSMPDAWVGSIDIAIAKARTAAFFSSDENALTSRIIGLASQAHVNSALQPDPNGTAGPLWGIGNSNQVGISGGPQFRNGLITFPGGVALYKNGHLVGGIGVSGDGVDQDEAVAFAGAAGFEPPASVAKLGYP